MVRKLSFGDQNKETHIRFRNTDDFECYINAIDKRYESKDSFSSGHIYETNTPLFNLVN